MVLLGLVVNFHVFSWTINALLVFLFLQNLVKAACCQEWSQSGELNNILFI